MPDIKNIKVDDVLYDIKDATARGGIGDLAGLGTDEKGDLVAAINELLAKIAALSGITYVESTDTSNLVSIREMESGTYVFYGKFKPFAASTSTLTFSSRLLVNVVKRTADTQVMVLYPVNNCVQYLKITDTTYERTNVYLNDLLEPDASKIDGIVAIENGGTGVSTLEELKELVKSESTGSGAQPDWNAAEGEPGHVLNRTHWTEGYELVEIAPETTFTTDENDPGLFIVPVTALAFEADKTYIITYNGTPYTCTAVDGASFSPDAPAGSAALGNINMAMGAGDTGEPFAAITTPGEATMVIDMNGATSITIAVSVVDEVVHKLPAKYIDREWVNNVTAPAIEQVTRDYQEYVTEKIAEANELKVLDLSTYIPYLRVGDAPITVTCDWTAKDIMHSKKQFLLQVQMYSVSDKHEILANPVYGVGCREVTAFFRDPVDKEKIIMVNVSISSVANELTAYARYVNIVTE